MLVPVDSGRARGSEHVLWMRKAEANTPVVSLDHLVTGFTGGDQRTAAELAVIEYRDETERERRN